MSYEINITKKRVKNIIVKVRKIGVVEVTVPYFVSKTRVYEILNSKNAWIEQKMCELIEANKIKFLKGDLIYFLGKKYSLDFNLDIQKNVEIIADKIVLKCRENDEIKETLIDNFYKVQSKDIFAEILKRFCIIVGKDIKAFKVRKMKTRWGSCNSTKSYINLNTELVKKDILAIEAVIMHELTHLYYANHSKAFYDKLLSFMPDYYERIKLLKNFKGF